MTARYSCASSGHASMRSGSVSSLLFMRKQYHMAGRFAVPIASPLRQLQLDSAVAAVGVLGPLVVERLELAESGGDQSLRRYPLGDQVLHHRNGARRGERPVRGELGRDDRAHVGVAVDAQDPGNL